MGIWGFLKLYWIFFFSSVILKMEMFWYFQKLPTNLIRPYHSSACTDQTYRLIQWSSFDFSNPWSRAYLSSSHFKGLNHSVKIKIDSGVWYQEVKALKSSDIRIWILLILLLFSSWSEVMLSQVHSVWYILTKTNPYIRCCAA